MSTETVEHNLDQKAPDVKSGAPTILIITGIIVLLAHIPLAIRHCLQIGIRPHYDFYPLVLIGSGVLAFLRFRELKSIRPGSLWVSLILIGISWALLGGGVLLYSSWLGAVSTIFSLVAILYAVGGRVMLTKMLPCLVLLGILIPPPYEMDRTLILSLRTFTAQWSSRLLDFLGVYHFMAGNVVEIGGRKLMVEDACSGINSLYSILACTLFLAFLYKRPVWHIIALVLIGFFWVLVINVARVVVITISEVYWDIPLSTGTPHTIIGFVFFFLALGLVWSSDRFLLFLSWPKNYIPQSAKETTQESANFFSQGHWESMKGVAIPVMAAFLLLLGAQIFAYKFMPISSPIVAEEGMDHIPKITKSFLPKEAKEWKQVNFHPEHRNPGSSFGEFSRTWVLKSQGQLCKFSIDYPFPSWHDLTRCYTSQGWEIQSQKVMQAKELNLGFVEVQFDQPSFRSGYLLFAQFNYQGKMLEPRPGAARLSIYRHQSILSKWKERFGGEEVKTDPIGPIIQIQLFMEHTKPLTAQQKNSLQELFLLNLKQTLSQWNKG